MELSDVMRLVARIMVIPALLGLPGYLISCLLGGKRGHREELTVTEACFSCVFLGVLFTSLCGLAVVELGRFSLSWLALLVHIPVLALALLRWRRLYPPPFRLK